ncbi:TIGR03756 family integrating conjugative element protein [Pseudomonas sp. NCHU5208]|uniref:TIGR03756 family integrating conjugative element protein n=1 Tax=unclassified Pseudomonas TaxID=196821 RepID=UPI003F9D531E
MRMPVSSKALGVLCLSFCGNSFALNTATITASTLSPTCLDYRVVGICYWLFCTVAGCKVRTSVKVRHYIPETVVSSYSQTGNNPWVEVAPFSMPNPQAMDGGKDHSSSKYSSLRFKNADVVGHPGGYALSQFASQSGYACATGASPYMPYFLSTLDSLAWRHSVPELMYPEALIPGMREIGSTADNWGHLYPRTGWVNQTNDYKAAAVVAQRAADIVTQRFQPHVYQPLTPSSRAGYWPPGKIKEGDSSTHKWQALWPKLEMTCATFPDTGLLDPVVSSSASHQSPEGSYAWSLWRPYSCCQRRGQIFLGSVDFQ